MLKFFYGFSDILSISNSKNDDSFSWLDNVNILLHFETFLRGKLLSLSTIDFRISAKTYLNGTKKHKILKSLGQLASSTFFES
jgi:hypothetical protein